MRISIIGAGYVGLVTGACLADKGYNVQCVDIDNEKVNKINKSISPIYEKDLQLLLEKNIGKKFNATTDLYQAVINSEITIIAVGTPFDGKEIDLKYIKDVSVR